MNYIQEITERIEELLLEDKDGVHPLDNEVYEYYALLVLTVGVLCTNENVHDAWAMWAIKNKPDHKWIRPYRGIPYRIQTSDFKFRDIIIKVAKEWTLVRNDLSLKNRMAGIRHTEQTTGRSRFAWTEEGYKGVEEE